VLSDFVVQPDVLKCMKLTSLFNLTSRLISFVVNYVYAFDNLISFLEETSFTRAICQCAGYTLDF